MHDFFIVIKGKNKIKDNLSYFIFEIILNRFKERFVM